MRNQIYPTQGMECTQPVLGKQPPLPRSTVVRYLQPEEESHDGTMVPVNYYGEEGQQASSSMNPLEAQAHIPEGQYQMDHNTLWFIANRMARPTGPKGTRPYKSRPSPMLAPRQCFNCGGDHWASDCPHPRKEKPQAMGLQPLTRFCNDCGIKHLF